jgi:hypothetical protein
MTRSEFAARIGAPESAVKFWGQPGGILHGRPYGLYTETDAAVCLAYLQLQMLMGERSPKALEAAKQLAPHVVAAVRSGRMDPLAVTITAGDGSPVKIIVDIALLTECVAA